MKKFHILSTLFALFALVVAYFGMHELAVATSGTDQYTVAFAVVALSSLDPMLLKKYGDAAFRIAEFESEFSELETGNTFARGSHKKSNIVSAPPIALINKLDNDGVKVDHKVDVPIFETISQSLASGAVAKQQRTGTEEELSRKNATFCVAEYFFGVKEDDIDTGARDTATVTEKSILRDFSQRIGECNAVTKDNDLLTAMLCGYGYISLRSLAERSKLANNAIFAPDTNYGFGTAPREMANTFVWHGGKLNKTAFNGGTTTFDAFETSIITELSKVKVTDTPTLKMLRAISLKCKSLKIPATSIKRSKGSGKMNVYMCYVPDSVISSLKSDSTFMETFSRAYMGEVMSNPLLNSDDIIFENLLIRSSTKLDQAFGAETSFNTVTAGASIDGLNSQFKVLKQTDGNNVTHIIAEGSREFLAGSDAATSFGGVTMGDFIKRITVLGASALARVNGMQDALTPKETTDYGRNKGLGQLSRFGHQRVNYSNLDGSYYGEHNCFQVLCYNGEA